MGVHRTNANIHADYVNLERIMRLHGLENHTAHLKRTSRTAHGKRIREANSTDLGSTKYCEHPASD
jgi:hypothetical protein